MGSVDKRIRKTSPNRKGRNYVNPYSGETTEKRLGRRKNSVNKSTHLSLRPCLFS